MLSYVASALLAVNAFAASGTNYMKMGADWGTLETDNASWKLCQTGKNQSPIDLSTTEATHSDTMEVRGINYYDVNQDQIDWKLKDNSGLKVVLQPHSDSIFDPVQDGQELAALALDAELQLTFDDGSKSFFEPLQFHFHSPSEHTVDGKAYDLEVHFVHIVKGSVDANGSPLLGAVVGVFFDVDEGKDTESVFIKDIKAAQEIAYINKKDAARADGTASFRSALKANIGIRTFLGNVDMGDFWSYQGSLTTPPCTEGIKWSVMKQVQSISAAQLAEIKDLMKLRTAENDDETLPTGSARKVQFLNDRTLYYSGAGSLVAGTAAAMAAIAALAF